MEVRLGTADHFTIDELIVTCISRQAKNGDLMAQGIATPLVVAGYILAKLTHAPDLIFAVAIGGCITNSWAPLSISRAEEANLEKPLYIFGFDEVVGTLMFTLQPKEFFRPAQVDPRGNFNNVVLGDYYAPKLRLPGCGGIADVTNYSSQVYLYVPRHSRAVFVERLDFVSGVGVLEEEQRRELSILSPGPRYLVTNLGTFDFEGGRMRLLSYHPGVSVERIQKKTGFPLAVAPDLHETLPPSTEEVRLLREEIDPLGIRELERLSGGRRRAKLREIIEREAEGF